MTDRDRISAWVAENSDHPLAPVVRELLTDAERADNRARAAGASAASMGERCALVERKLALAVEDAARLAGWIIAHPTDADPTGILDLHDRSLA